jgi:hypothetical protein
MPSAPRQPAKPPVFILGVPRSGTTLLRTLLDSHSQIACGPETPWLGGHQPRSVMRVWQALRDEPWGYCASYGMDRAVVDSAAGRFVAHLMQEYARSKGKARWAEKTPDNALYVDFLLTLFPEARCIHLVRNGLDVAVSTSVVEDHRKGISSFLERYLGLGPGVPPVENNPFNALLKWSHWDRLIERSLNGREHLDLKYERLVADPEGALREVLGFIGEPFEPAMLDYAGFRHEYPSWEWGSADVQARGQITSERVGRGQRALGTVQRQLLEPLAGMAGEAPILAAEGAYTQHEAGSELYRLMTAYLNGLSRPLGLGVLEAEAAWEASWLWINGLSRIRWSGARVVHGGGAPVLGWIAAMLGADVTFVAMEGDVVARAKLAADMHLNVNWKEHADDCPRADVVISIATERDSAQHAAGMTGAATLAATASGPANARRTMIRSAPS